METTNVLFLNLHCEVYEFNIHIIPYLMLSSLWGYSNYAQTGYLSSCIKVVPEATSYYHSDTFTIFLYFCLHSQLFHIQLRFFGTSGSNIPLLKKMDDHGILIPLKYVHLKNIFEILPLNIN